VRGTRPPGSPSIDGDGVRVFRARPARPPWRLPAALAAAVAMVIFGFRAPGGGVDPPGVPQATPQVGAGARVATAVAPHGPVAVPRTPPLHRATAPVATPTPDPIDWPSGDPRDLASHFRPGDPEPTAAEVIRALQESGDFTGLGAFNPPGTSPPLAGLAVPPDFVLPPGYVRHHQVTDEGVPLEPILMFAPDLVMIDANGRPIPLPDDRVVPPELAPPGLPIRTIEVPVP